MLKKTVWLLISCLMVLTLIISSCGEGEKEAPGDGEEEVVGATEPQYGGAIITVEGHSDPLGFLKAKKRGRSF